MKIADQMQDQHTPFKTAIHESVVGILPDLAAAGIGGKLGLKYGGPKGAAVGATAGTLLAGLGANYGVLKHQQLKQQKG